jgi:hypothetical protein
MGITLGVVLISGGLHDVASGQGRLLRAGLPQVIGAGVEFTHVGAAAFGPGGLVAVAQPQDATVLVFSIASPDHPVTTLGRRGEGPGEFRTPGLLGWRKDTLWVTDWGRPRIEFFASRNWSIASRVVGVPGVRAPGWRFRTPVGLLGDSTIVHYPSVTPAQLPAAGSAMPILLAMPDGRRADTVAMLNPDQQHFCVVGDRNGGRAASCSGQPITAENFVTIGENGTRLLLLLQAARGVKGGGAIVRVLRPDGRVVFERALSFAVRAVTNQEWDSVLTVWSRSFSQDVWSTERLARRGLSKVLRKPVNHPMVDQAVLGRDGTVWIREARPAKDGHRWHILNPDGTTLGVVTLPSKLRVLDADRTQCLGVMADADGVESLVRLSITQ